MFSHDHVSSDDIAPPLPVTKTSDDNEPTPKPSALSCSYNGNINLTFITSFVIPIFRTIQYHSSDIRNSLTLRAVDKTRMFCGKRPPRRTNYKSLRLR